MSRTDERDDEIERLFLKTFSYDDIAKMMKLSRNQVAGVCHRRGLRRPDRAKAALIARLAEEAAFKAKRERVAAAKKAAAEALAETARFQRAIDERDLDILSDVKEGHSRRDIGRHWGVTESFVNRLVKAAKDAA